MRRAVSKILSFLGYFLGYKTVVIVLDESGFSYTYRAKNEAQVLEALSDLEKEILKGSINV